MQLVAHDEAIRSLDDALNILKGADFVEFDEWSVSVTRAIEGAKTSGEIAMAADAFREWTNRESPHKMPDEPPQ